MNNDSFTQIDYKSHVKSDHINKQITQLDYYFKKVISTQTNLC